MYQATSSTTTEVPFSNVHLSPPSTKPAINGAVTPGSESDLSEAIDVPSAPAPLPNGELHEVEKAAKKPVSGIESSQDEDAHGSDDPDYDMATPHQDNAASSSDVRSSSQDSPRHRKRKAAAEHDDFMLNDPELYGLRRSVSNVFHSPVTLLKMYEGSSSSVTTNREFPFSPSPLNRNAKEIH